MVKKHKWVVWVIGVCVLAAGVIPVQASPVRQQDPTQLVYGQTVDGKLDAATPSQFYVFEAATGDVVTITMVATAGELDPFLVLNDTDQNSLTTDDNSGGGVNARLTFTIPAPGRYVIRATHAGGVVSQGGGSFSLNLTAAVGDFTSTTPPAGDLPQAQGDSTRFVPVTPGSTVRDTVDRQVALRFYWFEADAGDQVAVIPEQLADFQPLLALYDADFQEVARAEAGTGLRARLEVEGIFFLVVALPDPGSAGGSYGLLFDVSGNPARQGNFIDMSYGQSQRGNIDDSLSAVTYRFQGSADDEVTIAMNRAGGDLNSYLYLLDGEGQLLFEDNDSGGDNGNARLVYMLPADGDYLIVATRLGQAQGTTSGSYLLELQSDAVPPSPVEETGEPEEPTLPTAYSDFPMLAYGETVEGQLSNARYVDFYVFFGIQGDPITVEMVSGSSTSVGDLDPLLILLDNNRIPLIENDDIEDGVQRDSRIEFTLPYTGYYAVVATRFEQADGTTAGPYTLMLSGPGSAAPAGQPASEPALIRKLDPIPLESGVPAQDVFDGGADLYTFTASAGTLIDVAVTTDPGLDSVLILADAGLTEIVSSGTGALTGITAPETGRYLIVLAPRFGPSNVTGGGYILALTQTGGDDAAVTQPTGPFALVYGDTVTGVIDDDMPSQTYTFSGVAGDTVRITMEAMPGSPLDCYLELQDATGAVVDANDDIDPGVIRDSEIVTELPANGDYVIVASRYVGPDADATSGSYELRFAQVTEADLTADGVSSDVVPLVYGRTEVGEITDDQYLVFYVFEGTAGDTITVEINTLSGNLDSVLHLYRSAGSGWAEIASNDDSPRGGTYEALLDRVVLPQTGKYLIAVSRYGLDRENTFGTFTVTLTRE
ncbi:MAG: PPC domain-containing protein [Anaerolineae bacterium]|nr:PPC domain-containing protein [Anaerolineae bacterium]